MIHKYNYVVVTVFPRTKLCAKFLSIIMGNNFNVKKQNVVFGCKKRYSVQVSVNRMRFYLVKQSVSLRSRNSISKYIKENGKEIISAFQFLFYELSVAITTCSPIHALHNCTVERFN